MRKLITIFLVCACVLLTTTAARGGLIISFDENGSGKLDTGTSIIPLDYGVEDTLYYVLPIAVVEGDVAVMEESGLIDTISDVLRFVNNPAGAVVGSRVYVYSDMGESDLADVGIPPLGSNVVEVREVVVNGLIGVFDYTPASGQPGGNPYPGGTLHTYNFTSDVVPEPATIAMLGLGVLSLLRRKR
jgi:hypothetical protein